MATSSRSGFNPRNLYGTSVEDNVFRYVHSNELDINVSVKIGTLEGNLPRLTYQDLLNDPILKFSGRNLSKFPDLKIEAVVVDYPDRQRPRENNGTAVGAWKSEESDDDDDDDEGWGGCKYPRPGGVPLHSPIFTSYKHFTKRWEWNEWIKLPVKYSDLPRTAMLAVTIYDCCGSSGIMAENPHQVAVGGTTISLFCKNGTLRQGPIDLKVWPGVSADPRTLNRPGYEHPPPDMDSPENDTSEAGQTLYRLAKLTKKYRAGKIQPVDWLDRLSFAEIERINQKEKSNMKMMFLDLQFTQFQHKGVEYGVVYFEPGGDQILSHPAGDHANSDLIKVTDYEIGQENLVEAKHYWLARSTRTGQSETELKPNATIRNRLNEIILCPPTQNLSSEELDLVWRYRLYLSANKKALTKFVKCINWRFQAEQALDLIKRWAPMDVEDALELLGPSFTDSGLRQYAVNRMRQAPDADLQLYLLQLVQALKYEPLQPYDPHQLYKDELDGIGRPMAALTVEETIDDAIDDIPDTDSRGGANHAKNVEKVKDPPPTSGGLAQFLIERACKNNVIANYFFWYLIVECEDHVEIRDGDVHQVTGGGDSSQQNPQKASKQMYAKVLKRLVETLNNGPAEWQARAQFLFRQYKFVDELVQLIRAVARESGSRQKKIDKLQALLKNGGCGASDPKVKSAVSHVSGQTGKASSTSSFSFVRFDPALKLPLDPGVDVSGVIPERASLFKSSLAPARVVFVRADTGEEYVTIFKHGDDLRQDQLILQVITLFDRILLQENLDLKLTPYRVLATSSRHGFVQFVDSLPIAEILASEHSIQNYFRKHNPSESGPYGIQPEVMNTYVKSCAGYCVITYLLGVGDRHLDNLLLTKSGKLFHIDFGYILGRDPKPMPPPMKLSKEMIDAFGGEEYYQQFRRECYTAFLSLRRHANLILNLFSLMVDASVPDIALEPDKTVRKVQDKFRLDLNDEEAVNHIQTLIDNSASAVMPAIVERIHKFAQLLRN